MNQTSSPIRVAAESLSISLGNLYVIFKSFISLALLFYIFVLLEMRDKKHIYIKGKSFLLRLPCYMLNTHTSFYYHFFENFFMFLKKVFFIFSMEFHLNSPTCMSLKKLRLLLVIFYTNHNGGLMLLLVIWKCSPFMHSK